MSASVADEEEMSNHGAEDFEEVECDLAELLNHYKFHPLNYFFVSEINLLGKTDEFHLYSFYSQELEQTFVLKVLSDEALYEVEKRMCTRLEGTLSTLKLVNAFTFEFPSEDKRRKDRQYYFIFEAYSQNIIQLINRRSSQMAQRGLSEGEMRTVVGELIEVFADLQRKRIAHRNIKPANIVMVEPTHQKKTMRICNFELAAELKEGQETVELAIEACSIIYASPLILGYFTGSASPSSKDLSVKVQQQYSPFKEDVFSLGLTLLQLALFCNCQ